MDSHGSCFGPFATSARVGSGDGVDFAAGGSSASVLGVGAAALGLSSLRLHRAPWRSGQAPGCGVVARLAPAVTVLRHHHLTVHSSRTGFASRLNSGVMPQGGYS